MSAAIDNTFLTLLLNPEAQPRPHPRTGLPTTHIKQRIEGLVDDLSGRGQKLVVPSPAIAEALCCANASAALFDELHSYDCIEVGEFNSRAALELSRVIRLAKLDGDKRSGQTGNWQHIKMDRMIVAIAVVYDVDVFYSDDARQLRFAELAGLRVMSTWDLPLPASHAQERLPLDDPNDTTETESADRRIPRSRSRTGDRRERGMV